MEVDGTFKGCVCALKATRGPLARNVSVYPLARMVVHVLHLVCAHVSLITTGHPANTVLHLEAPLGAVPNIYPVLCLEEDC